MGEQLSPPVGSGLRAAWSRRLEASGTALVHYRDRKPALWHTAVSDHDVMITLAHLKGAGVTERFKSVQATPMFVFDLQTTRAGR